MNANNRAPAFDLPQISVDCPACGSLAGLLCTSHGGARVRRNDTHVRRRAEWVAARDAKGGDRS